MDDFGAWELELLADCDMCAGGYCEACDDRSDVHRWCPHICGWLLQREDEPK